MFALVVVAVGVDAAVVVVVVVVVVGGVCGVVGVVVVVLLLLVLLVHSSCPFLSILVIFGKCLRSQATTRTTRTTTKTYFPFLGPLILRYSRSKICLSKVSIDGTV